MTSLEDMEILVGMNVTLGRADDELLGIAINEDDTPPPPLPPRSMSSVVYINANYDPNVQPLVLDSSDEDEYNEEKLPLYVSQSSSSNQSNIEKTKNTDELPAHMIHQESNPEPQPSPDLELKQEQKQQISNIPSKVQQPLPQQSSDPKQKRSSITHKNSKIIKNEFIQSEIEMDMQSKLPSIMMPRDFGRKLSVRSYSGTPVTNITAVSSSPSTIDYKYNHELTQTTLIHDQNISGFSDDIELTQAEVEHRTIMLIEAQELKHSLPMGGGGGSTMASMNNNTHAYSSMPVRGQMVVGGGGGRMIDGRDGQMTGDIMIEQPMGGLSESLHQRIPDVIHVDGVFRHQHPFLENISMSDTLNLGGNDSILFENQHPTLLSFSQDNKMPDDVHHLSSSVNVGVSEGEEEVDKSITEIGEELAQKMHEEENELQNKDISKCIFSNESRVATIWLVFIAVYWTLSVWIPTLLAMKFFTGKFVVWCVGFCFILGCCYTLNDGQYPSGATRDNLHGTHGIGRWTALALIASVILDFPIMGFFGMDDNLTVYEEIRGTFHLLFIFWTSLFFYKNFRISNPQIATVAFFSEWVDVVSTSLVIFTLHHAGEHDCFDLVICVIYFWVVLLKLIGWMAPMMCIQTWGTKKGASVVSKHLIVLDFCTDVPVIIAVLADSAYKLHPIIFIDVLWKNLLIIHTIAYYVVHILWLRKGHKIFIRTRAKNKLKKSKKQAKNCEF